MSSDDNDRPPPKIVRPMHYGQVCSHMGEHADFHASSDVDTWYEEMQRRIRAARGPDELG